MLAQKKRRRKRKKSLAIQQQPTPPSSAKPSGINLEKPKAKLSQSFISEELEVKSALSQRPKTDSASTTHEEQIKFFSDHIQIPDFEIDDSSETAQQTPSSGKTGEGLQLASSYVQVEDENPIQKWTKMKLEINDKDFLYYPRRNKINLIESENRKPNVTIIDDDDGLCQSPLPSIKEKHKIQFINRILEEGVQDQWIDPKNPTEIIGLKSFIDEDQYIRSKSSKIFTPIRFESTKIDEISSDFVGRNRILKMQISDVIFDKHPAYNQEHNLARNIEYLHKQYLDRKNDQIVDDLQNKLSSLRHLISEMESDPKVHRLKQDRVDLRNQIHREEKIDRDILRTLLEQWKRLKDLREKQGFNSTSIRVLIIVKESDVFSDQQNWDTEFSLELHEILDEMFEVYNADRQLQKHALEEQDDFELIKKLNRPDIDDVHSKLEKIYQNSKRHPGEPIISIELERISISNGKDQNVFDHLFYSFEVLFDGQKVSSDGSYHFGDINLNCSLSIKLTRKIPDTIQLLIFEQQRLRSKQNIVGLYIPVPQSYDLFNSMPKAFMNFSSFQTDIAGKIGIKIGWAEVDSEIDNKSTPRKQKHQKINEKIQTWYNNHLIDPLDPEVNSIIESLQKSQISPTDHHRTEDSKFRLNEDLTAFCSIDELNSNKRLNMLQARFNNDLRAKNKLVPHSEREIMLEDKDMKIIEELGWIDPIDVQRHKGKKYLKNIYEIITNHFETMADITDDQSLLIDDNPPSFRSFLSTIAQIFGPKRPLNPQRRQQKIIQKTFKPSQLSGLKIIVNVIRATGIPTRLVEQIGSTKSSVDPSPRFSPQRRNTTMPYVMATFKDKTIRTTTAEGSNPTWNEQLSIPISGTILRGDMKGILSIQIFDEIVVDLMDETHSRESEIYQRIYSNWIGELRIPFSTIYTIQRLEGTFELTSPSTLFGYSRPSVTSSSSIVKNMLEAKNSIYLTVFVNLEPNVEIPRFSTFQFECTELNEVKNHINIWYNEYREEFPHRSYDPLVSLSNGKRICITRLIGPISLPFDRSDMIEYLIRRFVSLIPVIQSGDFCTKLEGIWLTNEQIINILFASYKDLGVLLTCYYLSILSNAFLVLGHTLLEGDTTFVLIKESFDFFFVNPQTGKKYSSKDTLCPLVKVYCLVNSENVWANVQKENRVFLTKFDVTVTSEWRPLFTKSFKAPTGPIQNVSFEYRISDDVMDLKRIIELKLMKKISSWRTDRKTTWNRNLNETLRQILIQLEEDSCYENDKKSYVDKMAGITQMYKVTGFPLQMKYVNLSSIVERVKMTGIHLNTDNRVEFSLAVHIQPYPNNVLSIWIFLLALIPKVLSF